MPQKFDEMRLKIKQQLMKDGNSEEEADKKSWAIATQTWKKSHGGKGPSENYTDKDGKFIVGENVKLIIEANISSMGEVIEE